MDRNSEEYRKFAAEYEADKKRRANDPVNYPWFEYQGFGWHNMTYLSDKEKDEAIKFYKGMFLTHDEKGNEHWRRIGRQPIDIIWCGDREVKNE